jgi:hypothetical protein
MTGHEPLIRMRMQRFKPAHVTLNDRSWAYDWWRCEHLMPYPDIGIDPEEAIERLDLRFVVGLPVMVEQRDRDRLRRLMLACEKAGAKRVYGFAPGVAVCSVGEDQTWRKC